MPTKLMCWLGDKGRQACPQKKKKPSKSGLFGKSNRLENAKVERPAKSGSLGMNNKIGLEHDMTNKAEMRQGHTRTTLTRHTNVKLKSLNATYGRMEMTQGTSTMAGGVELQKRQSGELVKLETH